MTKTFGKLTKDEKKELLCAWVDGKKIEYLSSYENWQPINAPAWCYSVAYRIKSHPVVKTYISYGYRNPAIWDEQTSLVWYNYHHQSANATHKLTVTEIDGIIQTNALVERL